VVVEAIKAHFTHLFCLHISPSSHPPPPRFSPSPLTGWLNCGALMPVPFFSEPLCSHVFVPPAIFAF
jgi:hypothetical protein